MNAAISVQALQTRIYKADENLSEFVLDSLKKVSVPEKSIVAVTSKIVSLAEGRKVPKSLKTKEALVKEEADLYYGEIAYGCHLTVKHGLLIPSAGIDESNSEDDQYILYPVDPYQSAKRLQNFLREKLGLQELGLILTDSHTTPLRQGVTGVALSYWGFHGVKNFIGQRDLFGRTLQMTQVNAADALASMAVFLMGEANESCPVALISGADVKFTHENIGPAEIRMDLEKDLYGPLLKLRV